ncbi:hypothetical protein EON62_03615 [archaeon]|nr:MAG: hypothetical protein EON62_03615 [archaeon]
MYERDAQRVVVSLGEDANHMTMALHGKDGGVQKTKEARRDIAHRANGKLLVSSYRNKEIFERLTADAAKQHEAWAETQRTSLLGSTLADTSARRGIDGAISFIPAIGTLEPFDEAAVRRMQRSSRHTGRQLLSSPVIVGRPGTAPPAPSFPYKPAPYMDQSAVVRTLRETERRRVSSALPEALRTRKAFRATDPLTSAQEKVAPTPYISSLVDVRMADTDVEHIAAAQRKAAYVTSDPCLEPVCAHACMLVRVRWVC